MPDMVDTAEIGRLAGPEFERIGAMLQDGEINVAIAGPDAVLPRVLWLPDRHAHFATP